MPEIDTAPRHHHRPPDQDPAPALDRDGAPALAAHRTPARAPSPAAATVVEAKVEAAATLEVGASLPPPGLSRPHSTNRTTTTTTNHPSVPTTAPTFSCKATPAPFPKRASPPTAAGSPRRRPTAPPRSGTPARAPTSRPSSATWPACRAWPGRPTAIR